MNASRNGRGSRFPKKLPVCVILNRFPGTVLEPREVVEVASVRDHADRAARAETSHLFGDRLRHAGDRVGAARDELRDLLRRRLACTGGGRVVTAVLVRDERIAEIGDPARAGRFLHSGADEVHRGWRRRRDHGVDALAAGNADRGRDRGEVPRHARIRQEETPRRHLGLQKRATETVSGPELLDRLPRPRPEVSRAVDPRLRRNAQLGVRVHPLRVVRREHVRLDAERGKVLRELERALHTATAGGREVHRHEQHLHGKEA